MTTTHVWDGDMWRPFKDPPRLIKRGRKKGCFEVAVSVFRGKETTPRLRKIIVAPDEIRPTPQ